MNMILHNLKVACRNLMKYKLQTILSILCIAIGIVTLAFTHSILLLYEPSPISNSLKEIDPKVSLSPTMPIIMGCLTVIVLIFAVVGLQIHKIMRTDPAKIIAKE